MKENKKIKVVWTCHFSNKEINEKLPLKVRGLYAFLYRVFKGKSVSTEVPDFGVWNINALNEMKNFTDKVDLHIVAPYPHLEPKTYEFEEDGIHYHFFRPSMVLVEKFISHFPVIYRLYRPAYKGNRSIIMSFLKKINPSIIHLVGAENPYYSLSGLDKPHGVKLIVQLQTLMSDPKFFSNYPIDKYTYYYRSEVEKAVIAQADYVGTTIDEYRKIILKHINHNAKFLDFKLAVGEKIKRIEVEKLYDFVYFARSISKAGDWAVESFIEASKKKSGITLLVVGGYTQVEKEQYDKLLAEHGLFDNVTFTGELPTHDDVLSSVAQARVALLPIKIDFIPGTIREANALGLPVVTSITDGTPLLNEKRRCALLSSGGDHQTMSDNMLQVLDNPALAEELVQNSYIRLQEAYDNYSNIATWVEGYERISK